MQHRIVRRRRIWHGWDFGSPDDSEQLSLNFVSMAQDGLHVVMPQQNNLLFPDETGVLETLELVRRSLGHILK